MKKINFKELENLLDSLNIDESKALQGGNVYSNDIDLAEIAGITANRAGDVFAFNADMAGYLADVMGDFNRAIGNYDLADNFDNLGNVTHEAADFYDAVGDALQAVANGENGYNEAYEMYNELGEYLAANQEFLHDAEMWANLADNNYDYDLIDFDEYDAANGGYA